MLFGSLFKFNGLLNYSFILFANLSNIFTVLVFILQFKTSFKKLIIFQFIAFISAFYWVGYGIVQKINLSDLHIGYWNWLFGIFFMLLSMFASIKERKAAQRTWACTPPPKARRIQVQVRVSCQCPSKHYAIDQETNQSPAYHRLFVDYNRRHLHTIAVCTSFTDWWLAFRPKGVKFSKYMEHLFCTHCLDARTDLHPYFWFFLQE